MFWYKRMHDAPDQYCTLGHTIVKVRSDGTAMTRFQFQVKGNEVSDATRMNEEMLSALLIDEKLIVDEPSEAEVENILNLPDVSWEEDSSSPSEDDSTTPRASPVHMPYSSSFSSVFSTSDRVEELESVPHPITTSSSSSNKVRKHSTTSRAAEEEMLDPNLTLHDDIINDDVLPFLPTSNTTIEVERKLLREKQMKSSEIILVPYNLTGILTLQLDQEGKVYHVDVQAQLLDNFSNNRTDMAR